MDDIHAFAASIQRGDRAALAQAITLVESTRSDDRLRAVALLEALLPHTGGAYRIAVTGPPGAGKSTLLNALGCLLVKEGFRVAVLAIDPTSEVTGGSILGDKTRMRDLSLLDGAFVRPSPSRLAHGGVSTWTHEAMLLCEAAGFDVIFIETLGVGQGETRVKDLVDCCLLLCLSGAGDALQGLKKGILESADLIGINKADGEGLQVARMARGELQSALRMVRPDLSADDLLLLSGLEALRVEALWMHLAGWKEKRVNSGDFEARRSMQHEAWMWISLESRLWAALQDFKKNNAMTFDAVRQGTMLPERAAMVLKESFLDYLGVVHESP